MWKKIQSLLFEEDEEIIEEVEERVEKPKVKKSVIASMNPELKPSQEVEKASPVQSFEEDEIEEILEEKEVEIKEVKRFGISVDDTVKKVEPKKEERVEVKAKVYEFHPVISPMFGETATKHKEVEPRIQQEAPATLPRSIINTVISPIYGDLEVKKTNFVPETKKVVVKKVEPTVVVEETIIDVFEVYEEPVQKEEVIGRHVKSESVKTELEHLDLEDLIGANTEDDIESTTSVDDDAHQFSLFDEN